eukprot:8329479-Prorocentrum_lima.AAC.1
MVAAQWVWCAPAQDRSAPLSPLGGRCRSVHCHRHGQVLRPQPEPPHCATPPTASHPHATTEGSRLR